MSDHRDTSDSGVHRLVPPGRTLQVALGTFAVEGLTEEAAHQGVSVEALVAYAAMYFLADIADGRAGRRRTVPGVDASQVREPKSVT